MGDLSLYLSPHLDDAVLSCAGHILHEREQGRRVVVATLFSEGGEGETGRRLYRARRDEDRRALAVLGAECLHLGLLDAPFRDPYYRSFQPLLLGRHVRDAGDEDEAAGAILELWRQVRPARLYCPLGVGTHIDHRLTYRAARRLPAERVYYEDRPYALVREQVEMRLAELGVHSDQMPDAALPTPKERRGRFLESFRNAGYVRTYLEPGSAWETCERILVEKLEQRASCGPFALRLRAEHTCLDDARFEVVQAAVFCYASQVSDLFGTVEGYRRETLAYSAVLQMPNRYIERRWCVVDTEKSYR
jgi:hypothetical protein